MISILDHTTTKFGARTLKSWVGRPLIDKGYGLVNFFEANNLTSFVYGSLLQDRVDAVEEIVSSSSEKLLSLGQVLKKLPDLAKGLCRIQYGKVRQQ